MSEANGYTVESRRPNRSRNMGFSSLSDPASQSSIVVNIPCEIFIDICKFLPPLDLFTLSNVCKKFRNWLFARSNFGTEQIWKTSRINWLPHLQPPPNGMSEQCYIFLHLIELGCQFCGSGKFDPRGDLPYDVPAKINWCFRVRCCQRCLFERTVTSKQIKEEGHINSDVLRGLPYYARKDRPFVYWKSQVETAHQEYMKLNKKDLDKWMHEKSIRLHNSAKPAEIELSKTSVKNRLKLIIHQLSLVVPNDASRNLRQVEVELMRCPTYKKYASKNSKDSKNQAAKLSIRLFNENHWNLFQNLIMQEYEERRKYAALRTRQFDIFRKVHSMIPERLSVNDPIVQYLPHCRSFKRPPFHYWDATIPWGDNFLERELIPTLCNEAAAIAQKSKRPYPITKPIYAQKLRLQNRCVFQCRLCAESDRTRNDKLVGNFSKFQHHKYRTTCQFERHGREESKPMLFDYKTVRLHLQAPLHGVKNIVMDEMVTVDYLAIGKNILKRDSQLVCFFFPLND